MSQTPQLSMNLALYFILFAYKIILLVCVLSFPLFAALALVGLNIRPQEIAFACVLCVCLNPYIDKVQPKHTTML